MKKALYLLAGLFIGIILTFFYQYLSTDTSSKLLPASDIIGLTFSEAERDSMAPVVLNDRNNYNTVRNLALENKVPPALQFNPIPPGKEFDSTQQPLVWDIPEEVTLPDDRSQLAFYTVRELSSLIKSRKITVTELTNFFLERLKTYGDTLEAVVTLTEQRALEQAKELDQELADGTYRGPLHGIPYGLKDLFAVEGYNTTWGAMPYKDQRIDETAKIVQKLDKAGAVLVAKTTLGALAFGDVWFGGKTRNPWNLEQGSSGSSAGSAATTAAGLVPFAIGTETWGSIISPANRTGLTGLRPTFGRVSRHGAMALSWSMDKVGPLTRNVEDAALVFNTIHGPDGLDQTVLDLPFNYDQSIDLSNLRIGYLKSAFKSDYANRGRDSLTLAKLEELGADLITVSLPGYPVSSLSYILSAEAAAAFDHLTLSNRDDEMVRQGRNAWPNLFRAARFIPAVEYIQANRARWELIQKMDTLFQQIDLYVSPTYGGNNLLLTNLTGHPSVILPNGFNEEGEPTSITFMGDLFDEGTLLEVANVYQLNTSFHTRHPKMFTK